MFQVGDKVRVVKYPTHEESPGVPCQGCNLNGITGRVEEISLKYIWVALDSCPPSLVGSQYEKRYIFLPDEIEAANG